MSESSAKPTRLDVVIAKQHTMSRSQAHKAIVEGMVHVDDVVITKPAFPVDEHAQVTLDQAALAPETLYTLEPDPKVQLDVLYEDDAVLVVNKPIDMVVHPGVKREQHTLVHALIARNPEIKTVGEHRLRPGIVHRLDKDTSGVMIIAKTADSYTFLKQQFQDRRVKKTYIALVHGIIRDKEGTVTSYLVRSKQDPRKYVAHPKSQGGSAERIAVSEYRVETWYKKTSLLHVMPKTGRKHQIRAQFAGIGHPIVGDTLYSLKNVSYNTPNIRQFLHAFQIEIEIPGKGAMTFQAPLAPDLATFLNSHE